MKQLVVIAGPTASGKTTLAIELAKCLNAEIINADSRQFYKGLDIGTAKPTQQEQSAVKHHFIDIKQPWEHYSAGDFEKDVLHFLEKYFQKNDWAILVGGSGLYLKAVVEGFDDLPRDTSIRNRWRTEYDQNGLASLQNRIRALDPEYAETAELNNPQRLIRAIEICEITRDKLSRIRQGNLQTRPFHIQKFYLNPERTLLYENINQRVDKMIQSGLLQEVQSMAKFKDSNALRTVGYSELFDHLEGKCTLDYAIDKIKQHTRNYAKRQFTWFKKQDGFIPIDGTALTHIQKHLHHLTSV